MTGFAEGSSRRKAPSDRPATSGDFATLQSSPPRFFFGAFASLRCAERRSVSAPGEQQVKCLAGSLINVVALAKFAVGWYFRELAGD